MADLERLIQAIDAAEQSSYGSDTDSDLQHERALLIRFYNGENVEPAPTGRSQITDRTVFETIHWMLPSLTRIFANGDEIVEFQPFGPEDEEGARQESDHLNYLVTQKNKWPVIFTTWAMDALLSKNGYCEPYIEERVHTEIETYENQPDEGLALLLQEDGVEVVSHTQQPAPNAQPMVDPMTGQAVVPMLHTVTLRKSRPKKKLSFKVIPPERTKVDINTDSFSLEHANYFEYWDIVTISYLRSIGFDVPDDIASGDEDWDETEEADARNLYSEEALDGDSGDIDPAMRRVRVRCIWIRHDTDEDGIAELQKVYRVGSTILERNGQPAIYPCTRVGVASITPIPVPHRHPGTSVAEIAVDVQRVKTAMLRGGLDGFNLAISPRHIVSNEVNIDDLQVARPGGITRMIEGSSALPGEGHVLPISTPNTLPDAIAGLEYMGVVGEGRTGVSRAFSGVDPATLNKGNSSGVAINQLSTMASQRVEQIARMFSVGVEYLFSLAHELVIKSGHQPEVVKLRGRWVQIDPSTWKTGRDMRIVVGYGAGNKDALVSRLMMIANMQKEMLVGGLPTVTPQNVYETAIEVAKASDFSAPQRFFTDPATVPPPEPPQPSPDVVAAGQVEIAKTQSAERVKLAELQSKEKIEGAKLVQEEELEKFKAEVQIMLERMKLGGQADLERVRGSVTSEVERAKAESKLLTDEKTRIGASVLDKIKSEVAEATQRRDQAEKKLAEALVKLREAEAPKEIVRGKDGRVAGVKQAGRVRSVIRDKDGRIAGLQ